MNEESQGGTNIAGDAHVDGGDLVGRDKIVNVGVSLETVLAALKQVLPEGDPLPKYLLDTLVKFRDYHSSLHEWKELHNCLNDILIFLGPFSSEVGRIEIARDQPDIYRLYKLWRPVARSVEVLLEWARSIEKIGQPFVETEHGRQGPLWAIDLCVAKERLDGLLRSETVDFRELLDAHGEFQGKAERQMYVADKRLRETAGELYSLSQVVLGGLSRE